MFDVLRYAARPYMFTASPSPATIATAKAALAKLAAEPQRRLRLWENSKRLHEGFRDLGLDLGCDVVSPIVAVKCPDEPSTVIMWNALLDAGVYVNIAVPPGTPNRLCLLRCSVSAAHTAAEIDLILELFGKVVAAGHRIRVSA
jgi:7-keto-8-aminopelargonate synthetase-like enzyme